MEVANQYGIDMGNILSTVSALKTADQNREINTLKQDALKREATKQISSDKADQNYLADPKTAVATSIAQKLGWDNLDNEERTKAAAAVQERINQHGIGINNIMQIKDPTQQTTALQDYVSKLTLQEQQQYTMKYGNTPEQWMQNLPNTMNDLLVAHGGIAQLQAEQTAKTKQENVMAVEKFKGDTQTNIQGMKDTNSLAVQDKKGTTDVAVQGMKGTNAIKVQNLKGVTDETEGQRNVAAVMSANPGMTANQARLAIMQQTRTTNVLDPIYGNKTITSSKTPIPTNTLKSPQPMVQQKLTKAQVIDMAKQKGKDPQAALKAFGY